MEIESAKVLTAELGTGPEGRVPHPGDAGSARYGRRANAPRLLISPLWGEGNYLVPVPAPIAAWAAASLATGTRNGLQDT